MSVVSAGTGIHGCNQLEACRKFRLPAGTGNRDMAIFEWFPERFEYAPVELRQLIQKEDPVMTQGDLSRSRYRTAADQRGRRG